MHPKNMSSKLKHVRAGLRKWSRNLSKLSKLIYNCSWVLLLKRLVKDHLASLLEYKRIYWKQRNTVRWVKFGDENSSFFHTMATIAHKRNFI